MFAQCLDQMKIVAGGEFPNPAGDLAVIDGVGDVVGGASLVVVQADLQIDQDGLWRFALPWI